MSVWMNVKGVVSWKIMDIKIGSKGRKEFTIRMYNIIRAMHSLWSYNIFCLGRSVMDKFVARTPKVATEATGEVSQCIDSAPQKRSQYVIDILFYFWKCLLRIALQ